MQAKMISLFIGIFAYSLVSARPQGNYPYNYYTTASPYYQQNAFRIWPYILDSAVSPLYNWNWYSNAFNGYNTNFNNGYYNIVYGYSQSNPYNYNNNYNNYNAYGNSLGK